MQFLQKSFIKEFFRKYFIRKSLKKLCIKYFLSVSTVQGPRSTDFGSQWTVHGVQSMVHGRQCTVHDPRSTIHGILKGILKNVVIRQIIKDRSLLSKTCKMSCVNSSNKIPTGSRAPAMRTTARLTATEGVQSQEPPIQLQDMQGIHPTLQIYRSSSRLQHAMLTVHGPRSTSTVHGP